MMNPSGAIAILYRDELREYDFGPGHPFRGDRYEIFPNFLKEKVPEDDHYRIIEASPATDEDLLLICNRDYIDFTRDFYKAAHEGDIDHDNFGRYLSPDNVPFSMPGKIEEAARLIVGQARLGCDLIQSGAYRKAVSVGGGIHHAKASFGEGFCLYNDVAFAARYLINHHGLERVLILDTDAHAGNGTCGYFYDEPRVLFIDLHQDPHTLYPGTGLAGEIGAGKGKGFTVNVPLPPKAGYDAYERMFAEIVEPLAREFRPQLIIRNGGSDPHPDDDLTDLGLPVRGFRMIGERVRLLADELCRGRELDLIASGYNEQILPYCWLALISGLADWDMDVREPGPAAEELRSGGAYAKAMHVEAEIKENLKPYWRCFQSATP
jgi:acetoin utilization protein AcuC